MLVEVLLTHWKVQRSSKFRSLGEPSLEAIVFVDERYEEVMIPLKLEKSNELFVDDGPLIR